MGSITTITAASLTIRGMTTHDLLRVLRTAQQAELSQGRYEGFRPAFHERAAIGWVAEAEGYIVGLVLCTVTQGIRSVGAVRFLGWLLRSLVSAWRPEPLSLELIHVHVAPEWRRRGVGRALLAKLDEKLSRSEDCIHVTVPEAHLPVQLFLRAAGYKAVRVLRGHYGSEDGYLMERRRS